MMELRAMVIMMLDDLETELLQLVFRAALFLGDLRRILTSFSGFVRPLVIKARQISSI